MEVATDIHARLHQRLKVPPRSHIKKVVLLVGSSRGGTSHLFHLLQRSMQLLTPRAEELPFTKLYLPGTGSSDKTRDWNVAPEQADVWWDHLGCDVGVGEPGWAGDWETYPEELAVRLPMQWPQLDVEDVLKVVSESKYPPNQLSSALHMDGVDTRFYDGAGDESILLGPPRGDSLIEEPPFIKPLPRWRDWTKTTLLLKSSVNAYRLAMFPKLFGQTQVLHLLRNPAAAVNGLMDGWLWHGFFSRKVGDLAISGYSDMVPWGREWWNFDLPPGWERFRVASLAEVCAFQWASAHAAIINEAEETAYRVRYEDLLLKPEDTLAEVCSQLRIEELPHELMPVMATKQPERGRWKARSTEILHALRPYEDICEDLGYPLREALRWP